MALKHLTIAEMVTLTDRWLANDEAMLRAVPELVGIIPRVEQAHAKALSARTPDDPSLASTITALTVEAQQTDSLHDDAIRAVFYTCMGAAALARARGRTRSNRQHAEEIEALSLRLLPEGLEATRQSYLAEAGTVRQLAAQLDPSLRAQLDAIKIDDGTVLEAVSLWKRHGERLGEIERQRSEVSGRPNGVSLSVVRNQWITVVSTVMQLLSISSAPEAVIESVRRDVLLAAERAESRYSSTERDDTEHGHESGEAAATDQGARGEGDATVLAELKVKKHAKR